MFALKILHKNSVADGVKWLMMVVKSTRVREKESKIARDCWCFAWPRSTSHLNFTMWILSGRKLITNFKSKYCHDMLQQYPSRSFHDELKNCTEITSIDGNIQPFPLKMGHAKDWWAIFVDADSFHHMEPTMAERDWWQKLLLLHVSRFLTHTFGFYLDDCQEFGLPLHW